MRCGRPHEELTAEVWALQTRNCSFYVPPARQGAGPCGHRRPFLDRASVMVAAAAMGSMPPAPRVPRVPRLRSALAAHVFGRHGMLPAPALQSLSRSQDSHAPTLTWTSSIRMSPAEVHKLHRLCHLGHGKRGRPLFRTPAIQGAGECHCIAASLARSISNNFRCISFTSWKHFAKLALQTPASDSQEQGAFWKPATSPPRLAPSEPP